MTDYDDSTRPLRTAMIKPLPDATESGTWDPDREPRFIPNPDFLHTEHMIQELLRWTCLVMAYNAYHTSDSEVDSCDALVCVIEAMHKVNYGDGQTLSLQEAVDQWLDSEGSWMDLQMASDPNFETPADLDTPEIFSYFNLEYDAFDLKED